ncbi:MAG: UDP-4-amino-4-deoxy-L-arabinose-oxoglutarate aminotransferase [Candidatus Schekmanbacteria bacterium RIFCSPHIGHO2_02_FULL_38_11]|uniref:UDP-4-amino-4-deoxy-L-arabinose-oxoglutarate aminotransferase n=1 Tax=Candidatus Schekmanbacteria bacterium RIFCSPLOWO2_12_FULL_38_15 TaxID=1817883 RepID=A0A1F7SF51_9BACT|nr:MAG: UDP-4-amino-4-deoxy-L-arabinose-oxoglutarate aminotransferase [Candidatus Schekmanbacteria bacterium GWA2_38_9]OGL50573.1 MAG: UDP-4-amino-4-deoxy-L-arabinose-oxoglutarate aminotransferase [Candidatus Schekmanbacteria bacterium RIFCSPLOWO2_02_FULL_38_14]OGL52436.1 MAG: UDP-4-amino-4-deoxy-L-arabinose-oxoglutarate aminotransferase [Candidatus Schekmanbacteria bacterium RIFCSPLOWO2_12_FULL_38_15]OGL52931.1 MAG: UDP-4-amino-4-deoxy-L-arabinose-oxoglutarate aminotransferase [Candidatus Schek
MEEKQEITADKKNHQSPYLSIVVPVCNEQENLAHLYSRLKKTLDSLNSSYEIIFIDDGSRDKSWDILEDFRNKDNLIKIFQFNRNYGQHTAILAGFELSRGEVIVTIDADLQNPPEEIPKLLKEIENGHDVVGGLRKNRKDPFLRKFISKVGNKVLAKITGIKLKDYGCMLRAYRKEVVKRICDVNEFSSFFIPALAYTYANNLIEIVVEHNERLEGKSKYNLLKLAKLNFDILTSFSLIPIQIITLLGFFIGLTGGTFGGILILLKIFFNASNGFLTLISILAAFTGLQVFLLGLIGEYIGRIYVEVRKRPRYIINEKNNS